MLCIGHRGAMGHEPENTLLSITAALSLGVDAVEIDVYNVEEHLVVIHDCNLARTTNGTGYLSDHSFAYLRSLDAGKGAQIPILEEVIDTVNQQALVNIELKGRNTASLVVNLLQKYFKRGWSEQDFVVSSFDHEQLYLVKTLCPQIKTGMLIYGLPWQYLTTLKQLRAEIVIASLDFTTVEFIDSVHRHNLPVWIYTVNEPTDIARLRAWGVDGIFTNYPERAIV